jgi:hypothetical protein
MSGQRFLRSICYSKEVIAKLDQLDPNVECAIDISLVETLLGNHVFQSIVDQGEQILATDQIWVWYVIKTEIAVFALISLRDREDVFMCSDFQVLGCVEEILGRPPDAPSH